MHQIDFKLKNNIETIKDKLKTSHDPKCQKCTGYIKEIQKLTRRLEVMSTNEVYLNEKIAQMEMKLEKKSYLYNHINYSFSYTKDPLRMD